MKYKLPFLFSLGVTLCFSAALVLTTGCELNVNADKAGSDSGSGGAIPPSVATNTPPSSPPGTPPSTNYVPPVGSYDQLDISGAVLLGPHKSKPVKHAAPTRALTKADKSGANVHMEFSTLNWPSQGSGKRIDGGCYIFWYSGNQLLGGLFDWHGVGQTVKTLGNIPGGYLDGQQPPLGASIWFCILSLDGSQRTFITKSSTHW